MNNNHNMSTKVPRHGSRLDTFKEQSKVVLFCQRSSIRGVLKIVTSPTTFLRVLWIFFVISMSILLLVTSVFLVLDYLNYNTAMTTRKIFDDPTEFPALTICSHNPFSLKAKQMWAARKAPTPNQFQESLRNTTVKLIRDRSYELGSFTLYDKMESYYATLPFDKTIQLGHGRDMIPYCMVINDGYEILAEQCNLENKTALVLRHFSHAEFFNCWTIEYHQHNPIVDPPQEAENSTETVESIVSIISLTPFSAIPELHDSFIMDMMTRGEGVKIAVHSYGTYPNMESEGINLQPGKMNKITYEPIHWKLHDTPNKPCMKTAPADLVHLNNTYRYTQLQCRQLVQQKKLIARCGCMWTMWPRPQIPTPEVPYCLGFMKNHTRLKEALECSSAFLQENKKVRENAIRDECEPQCQYFTYQTDLSVTKWVPSAVKLLKLQKLYDETTIFLDSAEKDPTVPEKYVEYLTKEFSSNVTSSKGKNISQDTMKLPDFMDESRYTYVSLTRKSRDTTLKEEKLVLDVYILLSRIGGMCSLSIGLTMSFFIELIEFAYLSIMANRNKKSKSRCEAETFNREEAVKSRETTRDGIESDSLLVKTSDLQQPQSLCLVNHHPQFLPRRSSSNGVSNSPEAIHSSGIPPPVLPVAPSPETPPAPRGSPFTAPRSISLLDSHEMQLAAGRRDHDSSSTHPLAM